MKEEILDICSPVRKKGWVVEARIIQPLAKFGLLEFIKKTDDYLSRIEKAKKSPLFDKFIGYES